MKKKLGIFTLVAVIAILIVLVVASILESLYGTDFSHRYVYGADWFCIVWSIFAILGVAYIFSSKLQRRPALFVLHIAFAFILVGAGVTHYFGREGYLYVREGHHTNIVTDDRGILVERLPFEVELELFEIKMHKSSEMAEDFVSHIAIDGDKYDISMNNICKKDGYRFLQASYDEDFKGTTLAVVHDPWGILITYIGYLFLLIGSLVWLVSPSSSFRQLLSQRTWLKGVPKPAKITVLSLVGAFVAYWIVKYIIGWQEGTLPPVLRSPLLFVHIIIIMSAYALLAVVLICGVIGLANKRKGEAMMMLSRTLLYPSIILLALGIFVGALWANISWGNYWTWDPKEVWALVTLLVYCFPVHYRKFSWLQTPKAYHTFCVLAFFTVLFTYFGVNYLLGGMHSYA
ncbi:MAG: cytochrome c biogenesis protein CcsA [Bacteroidales bacterium]|nr:cytochrome c biogenesis protein CcsA [Bacteroidales bacterium]